MTGIGRLVDRTPAVGGRELAAQLVPPRQFADASFDSYRPDPDHPSQSEALAAVQAFAEGPKPSGGFFRKKAPATRPGVYLDGGFGVGKTHLLAALWHASAGRKYFGTFIEYTALVGALGFREAVALLSGASLVAIDEFELDDPGDTMVMSRLLGELVGSGTRIAATSNTPPNALGEGRFAAADFLREIHALAERFDTVRIDGVDYRRRDIEGHARVVPDDEVEALVQQGPAERTIDGFDEVIEHLATVHPSRYVALVEGLGSVGLRGVRVLSDQTEALRFVAFVDRLYDAQVRVVASGEPLDAVFAADMLGGGYRKKYLRAISRLISLTTGGD